MNKPVLKNNFSHITWKVQRNSLCRSHVPSLPLLPCCAQAIQRAITINDPAVTHCYHPKSICHVRFTLATAFPVVLDK